MRANRVARDSVALCVTNILHHTFVAASARHNMRGTRYEAQIRKQTLPISATMLHIEPPIITAALGANKALAICRSVTTH